MKPLVRTIDTLSTVIGALAGLMLCAGLMLTCAEIVLRSGFSRTLFITEEYSGYLMCALTFCALGYTLKEKGHIRMTFLFRVVTGKNRFKLDAVCFAAGALIGALITFYTFQFFWDSVVTGSQSMQISETYLAIPQAFMPLGAGVMTLQFIAELLKTVLILKGDTEGFTFQQEAEDLGR